MGDPTTKPTRGRRAFLASVGAGAGLLAARGFGARDLAAREGALDYATNLRALGASLTAGQRELIVLPADHPSRQIANTIAILDRPHLGTLLSAEQRAIVERLYLSMLSPRGREAFAGTVAVEGRLDGCVLAIYGDPANGRAQAMISGGHVLLRGGGESAEGAAFGGGLAYGHQIGDGQWRIPGNSFAYHGDAANRLFERLTPAERGRAIEAEPPHELVLQAQAAGAHFPGVAIGSLSDAGRDEARQLVDTLLSCYTDVDRARAYACIDRNGGIGALHVAYYATHGFYEDMARYASLDAAERVRRGAPYWQVWRVEGPGTVVHFQGHPHVHAYIQIVRDPTRANLGSSLGRATATLEGEDMRGLLEASLRRATGEELAFYGYAPPGRFCPGEITLGLAYSLDPYRSHVAVATLEGRAMGPVLTERLAARGVTVEPTRRYRVATTTFFASEPDTLGKAERVDESETLLRDALVAHLRAGGLAPSRA
jgi:hypothetical protein